MRKPELEKWRNVRVAVLMQIIGLLFLQNQREVCAQSIEKPAIHLQWDWRMGAETTLWTGSPLFLRLEIQPPSFRWKAIHFVDSIGAQLLVPAIAPICWTGEGRQFLVFAFSPATVASLAVGKYRLRAEVVDSTGRSYRSASLTLQVIPQPAVDSVRRWRERWRIVHWLHLRGLTEQAINVAQQLTGRSPAIPLRQLTQAYFKHRAVSFFEKPSLLLQTYLQEWRWRRWGKTE